MPVKAPATAKKTVAAKLPQAPIRPQAPAAPKAVAAPVAPARPVAPPVALARPAPPTGWHYDASGKFLVADAMGVDPTVQPTPAMLAANGQTPLRRGPGRPSNAAKAALVTPAGIPIVSAPTDMISAAEAKELRATINTLKGQLEALQAAAIAAKKPANSRSLSEILDGGTDGIPATDWRVARGVQGARLTIRSYELDRKTGDVAFSDNEPNLAAFFAIPRATDIGGDGSTFRATGRIALHFAAAEEYDEAGNPTRYEGRPEYLTEAQFDSVVVWE